MNALPVKQSGTFFDKLCLQSGFSTRKSDAPLGNFIKLLIPHQFVHQFLRCDLLSFDFIGILGAYIHQFLPVQIL